MMIEREGNWGRMWDLVVLPRQLVVCISSFLLSEHSRFPITFILLVFEDVG